MAFLFVAEEAEPPQIPAVCNILFKYNPEAVWEKVPRFATAPVSMYKFPVIVVCAGIIFVFDPESIRLFG